MADLKNSLRENWVVALALVLIAAIVIVAILREGFIQYPQVVTASGVGTVPYTPDTAVVRIGVSVERALTATAALERLTTSMHNVVPALVSAGIPESAIVTEAYSITPQYDYPNGTTRNIGYSASQQVVITITGDDLGTQVKNAIEAGNRAGANQVMGILFKVSNEEELKQQAVIKAIAQAKAKADETAEAAGVGLGDIVGWWENIIQAPSNPTNPYMYMDGKGGMGEMAAQSGTVFPSGTQEIIMGVSLNYEVR